MSFNTTIDDVVFQQTTQPENIAEKPFIQKEWSNPIYDTNTSSNYNSNQVIFDTTTLSNSGTFVNYSEGMIIIPNVVRITKTAGTGGGSSDWTNGTLAGSDFMTAFKNSNVQFLHSISITYNNIDIVQSVPMTNAYLSFIQHSELSLDDEFLNGPLTGYAKDNSSSWYYNAPTVAANVLTGDSRGCGIGNNCNFSFIKGTSLNDTSNEGMYQRQKFINKSESTDRVAVYGNPATTSVRSTAKNFIQNTTMAKYIYYDCVLRLKDICPNLFKNLPMAKGMRLKITLTLNNNIGFSFSKNANGNFIYDFSTFQNVTSATNPIMISASYNTYTANTGTLFAPSTVNANVANNAGNYCYAANGINLNAALIPCGSSTLPIDATATYSVSLKIGSLALSGDVGGTHPRSQCILYVPSYRMSPIYEKQYFSESTRIKKIHYTELEYQSFTVNGGSSFNHELSSSCVRPKRLILIPFLNSTANFGLNPISSPFATEPATTSPCIVTNFNCQIANINIYPNDINYSYDHYLQELNGQSGVNANMVNGLVSSRINLVDFENNYGYIVCDLSRRMPEQDLISVSIRVRGTVQSPLQIDFHAFIEKEKIIEIDVMTGALINRY